MARGVSELRIVQSLVYKHIICSVLYIDLWGLRQHAIIKHVKFFLSTTCIVPPGGEKFSVSDDPVCNVHWDWATTTALPLGIHCSQNFLSKKVS